MTNQTHSDRQTARAIVIALDVGEGTLIDLIATALAAEREAAMERAFAVFVRASVAEKELASQLDNR